MNDDEALPIELRAMTPDDKSFVYNSFLKSHHDSSGKNVPTDHYYKSQSRIIDWLLSRCEVTVACAPDDPDTIYGWMAWERFGEALVIHYCFTKYVYRDFGVAKALWQHANPSNGPAVCTHTGHSFKALVKEGWPLTYDSSALITIAESKGEPRE